MLAAEIQPRQFPAGAVVMREEEVCDHFHLIVDGAAAVSVHGAPRPSLQRRRYGHPCRLHQVTPASARRR